MPSPTTTTTTTSSSGPRLLSKCFRDPELWFSDGDLVLVVQSTEDPDAHLFRVHKTLLEVHSPVFRKSLSGDMNPKSCYDGVRAIWVPQTTSRILGHFLRFLYKPYTDIPIRTLNDTGLCDGFLKLCKDLDARTTCIPMIKRLHSIWPSTLSAWDNTDAYIFASAQEYPKPGENCHGQQTIMIFHDDVFPEPVSAIRLGRLYNILDILPAAFYHLSRIDPSSDYHKMHTEPTRSELDSQQRLISGLRSARWAQLTNKDHYILAEFKDYVQNCLTKLMAESSPHLVCKSGMEEIYLDIVRNSMATRDILRELKIGFDDAPVQICNSCIAHGRKVTLLMRRDIWGQLSVVLG